MLPTSIALDAMGGDHAPAVVIQGLIDYFKDNEKPSKIYLVGKEKDIFKELQKYKFQVDPEKLEIVNALENISMRENFFSYWRKREETSIKKGIALIKANKTQAFVSAGHTGAITAIAKTELGTIPNIDRPALATLIPTLKGESMLVDVGANAESKPINLVQFALMGKIYLETIFRKSNPSIGLMSIGEEEVKGNELTKQTHQMLKKLDLNFIGNIEGKDVYIGETDLIVTDGFTGNVTLKVSEGVVEVLLSMLKREIMSNIFSKIGFFFLKHSLKRIKKKLDYSEYGGALLMGVNGIVVIGHGRSNAKAIKNSILVAENFIRQNVIQLLNEEISKLDLKLKELKYV